jgi:multidrug efflux pump subunit AcrA (membrane-fusion protein)
VPVDSAGTYYVWKLNDLEGKTTVERVDVRVDEMSGGNILILEGVQQGDLIAAAGVTFLRDGQQVRPMK